MSHRRIVDQAKKNRTPDIALSEEAGAWSTAFDLMGRLSTSTPSRPPEYSARQHPDRQAVPTRLR